MDLFAVHPKQIDERTGMPLLQVVWPHIEHLIKQACEHTHGEITPPALWGALENDTVQLWLIVDQTRPGPERFRAVVGTQLGVALSGMKTCTIIFCAGKNRKEWLHLLNTLAEWARSEGCKGLRGFMRRGWAKDLPQFKLIANVMELEL